MSARAGHEIGKNCSVVILTNMNAIRSFTSATEATPECDNSRAGNFRNIAMRRGGEGETAYLS
jgi:hypothetical protein